MDITNIQPPSPAPSAQLDLNVQNNAVQQQLQRLPVGVTLIGTVIGNDKNGNLIVRLAGNDLILSSPLALNKNAQIALKIDNVSGSFTATLLSVDGKTPASQPQTISNQLQQNPNNLFKDPTDPASLKLISVLNQGAAKPAPQGAIPQNSSLVTKSDIVSLTSPQTTNVKAILVTATPEIVQSIKAGLAQNKEPAGTELADSLPEEIKPGTVANLKITSAQNPGQNPQNQLIEGESKTLPGQEWMKEQNTPAPAKQAANNLQQLVQNFAASFKPLPNGNILLNAIVIDTKPNGELLVETRFGKMIIDAGPQFAQVQKGAVLNLEVISLTQAPKQEIQLPEEELPLKTLGRNWPALKEMTEQLAPQLGINALATKLAGIDNVFAARMAAFLNAVKAGDLREWLGSNNFDALESNDDGSAIIGKLKHDMGVMRDMMLERTPVNWQTTLFPIYDGRELHQARLHVKYLPDENNQPDKKIGTRFIVELDTGSFGEIQMDGLVHNNVSSKYFDMIIRTHQPLDLEMETGIRQIFTDAGQVTGFKGDIEFATMKEFPLKIFDTIIGKKLDQQIDHKGIEA